MTTFARSLGLGLLLAGIALAGWQPIDSITDRDTSDITCQSNARSVACDAAGNIHVVWRGRIGGIWQLWYSHLDAGDTAWAPSETLTNTAGGVCDPSCVIGSDRSFYVCWNNTASGVLHLLRRDTSGFWTELDSLAGQQGDSMVSLCFDVSGTLHAVWRRDGPAGFLVCYASHVEAGWSRPDTLTGSGANGVWPSIARSPDGSVMAVWWDAGISFDQILSRRRVAGNWLGSEVIYEGEAAYPCVAWGGQSYHASWLAGQYAHQRVLVSHWSETGWCDTMTLSAGHIGQPGVSIAAEADGALHVAWSGNDSSSPSYDQIQYRTRPADGTWQAQQHLTEGANNSRQRVSVTAGDGRVQVAWSDQPATGQAFGVRLRRYERVHDVGVLRIVQPVDTVDSGAVVQPTAWVKNFGEFSEADVTVTFRFAGYENQKLVPVLAPGEADSIVFNADTVVVRGLNVATCSTRLAGDTTTGNDVARDSFFVRVQDMAVATILAPEDTVNVDSLVPTVWVRNTGNVEASAVVHVWIADSIAVLYHDTAACQIEPESAKSLSFRAWQTDTGVFTCRCSVAYAPDVHPENDTMNKKFWVIVTDAGVSAIVSPFGTVDSGSAVIPLAFVRNYGSAAETFSVRLVVGTAYNATALVTALAPSESALVAFDTWTPTVRGTHVVRCSTMLAGDRRPGNDVQSCSVFVRVCDAAPAKILCPVGVISRGEVRPQVRLVNRGNEVASVPASFEILGDTGRVYLESIIKAVGPGDSVEAEFPPWTAQIGSYTGVCSTALVGDMQPGNDAVRCGFSVARVDAAVLAIRVPLDTISEGWVEPRVLVANYGDDPATFYAHFACERQGSGVFHDSVFVGLDSGQKEVTFREWKASPGEFRLLARVMLEGDSSPHNDSVSSVVYVESLESKHWKERAPVPRGPWGRKVRDGGSLVAVADGLLALKGANTRECYQYSAAGDSWTALAGMPLGADSHKVRAGAALCWDGNDAVFALKGTGTHEFWRYDFPGDSWHLLAALPEHTRGARYGSGLVFLPAKDTDKVFMVKGGNTSDFLVYWVRQNEWHARRPLPSGPDSAAARYGTCVALLGGRVFCLKGGTTEFYAYFPDGDSWLRRADLPRLSRGRKPAKGAALVSDGSRFLYAFKGGGCNEFWRYDVRADSWVQLDEIPRGNNRRKVGRGGSLAWFGGCAYSLKGGGSNELWCFDPFAALAAFPEPLRGVAVEAGVVQLPVARRVPVFLRCGLPAEYPVPDGTTAVVVTDAAGRVVARRTAVHHLVSLSFSRPGVYFVVMAGDSGTSVAKTTVVR